MVHNKTYITGRRPYGPQQHLQLLAENNRPQQEQQLQLLAEDHMVNNNIYIYWSGTIRSTTTTTVTGREP
jgi:hypothetical protein